MASIDELIQREINPFDRVNLKPGNFWESQAQQSSSIVAQIHQGPITTIEGLLDKVASDHQSRSILLVGDSGAGKSFLLDRLKRNLNDKAFFAYIGPWADSDHIWRHVLRYTVVSLMQVPIGQTESQLMQWLKGLSAFNKRSLKQRIFDDSVWGVMQSDRQKFIQHLKKTYKTANIHSPDIFFGVLHDLTNEALYDLACDWLQGSDLSEESMQQLRVKRRVDSEDDAKTILLNISKIATETQPIVLCFDQLDNIPETNGVQDFQPLFNINTLIHNDGLKNFLVIISIITDTWHRQKNRIKPSDRARFEGAISLKQITLKQAQALWAEHLKPLHKQAAPKPPSPIFPLEAATLEENFPGGKTLPRNAIALGKKTYQDYKLKHFQKQLSNSSESESDQVPSQPTSSASKKSSPKISPTAKANPDQDNPTPVKSAPPVEAKPVDAKPVNAKLTSQNPAKITPTVIVRPSIREQLQAEFELEWEREYRRVAAKIPKPTARSTPELIQMLQEVLNALEVPGVKLKFLSGKYANYSLQYKHPKTQKVIGLVWTEELNMNSFYHVMMGCKKASETGFQDIKLLRSGTLGEAKAQGHKLHRQLFVLGPHQHIKPKLSAIHTLATYHSLVNASASRELVLADKVIMRSDLAKLVRETNVLQSCQLLQELALIPAQSNAVSSPGEKDGKPVHDYIMNLMVTQQMMGLKNLIYNTQNQFPDRDENNIKQLIKNLCNVKKISIINTTEALEKQTVVWYPETAE